MVVDMTVVARLQGRLVRPSAAQGVEARMTRTIVLPRLSVAVISAVVITALLLSPGAAMADCRGDLVASQQALQATMASVAQVDQGPETARCPAYRRHYAALMKVREVFGRCDAGTKKAANAAALDGKINDFRRQAPKSCRL
jgi:hypothetical protein